MGTIQFTKLKRLDICLDLKSFGDTREGVGVDNEVDAVMWNIGHAETRAV